MVTGSPAPGMELPVIAAGPPPRQPSWFEVDSLRTLAEGDLTPVEVGGRALVVANVEGTLLAYRDACASCGSPLHAGDLRAGTLACPGCGRTFFLPRAGRSMDEERIQLEPVPLLREQGRVKVAVGP
jgi:nitrite reductase/ring-hydroxylating ferredoxin subunit